MLKPSYPTVRPSAFPHQGAHPSASAAAHAYHPRPTTEAAGTGSRATGEESGDEKEPLSFVALADMATIPFKPDQPLKRYVAALRQILQEGKVYEREGNHDMAFVFFVKVSRLINEYLPTHPEWPNTSQPFRMQLTRESNDVDARITALRAKIITRTEEWERRKKSGLLKSKARKTIPLEPNALTLRQVESNGMPQLTVAPLSGPSGRNAQRMPLPGEGDDDDLVPQAQLQASTSFAPTPHQQILSHPYAVQVQPPFAARPWHQPSAPPFLAPSARSWTYPHVAAPSILPIPSAPPAQTSWPIPQPAPNAVAPPIPPPPIPPLPQLPRNNSEAAASPPAADDDGEPTTKPSSGGLFRTGSLGGLPLSLVRPTWAKRIAAVATAPFQSLAQAQSDTHDHEVEDEDDIEATTEGGQPLRTVIIPFNLVATFEKMASKNTQRKIETCGLLMGTLSRNRFTITHLLVPKQTGTSDTCTTTHEEEQMAYQEQHDLMTLGWIHTHPTQSCFMSSLDLHTHASYQMMLPEAIAIVVAPTRDPSFGIFRLTDPPGLETIVKCDMKGVFHPHPDLPLYTDCDETGFAHVRIRKNSPFVAKDLR